MTMNDNEKPLAYLKYCDQILPFKNARHRRSFFFSLPYIIYKRYLRYNKKRYTTIRK